MVSRRLSHITFHKTAGGPAAGRLLAVAQLTLAQLAGVHGLGGASAGGHGGEVLSVVRIANGERPRTGRPDRRARIAPADRTLGVLRDMVGVRDGRWGAAAAVSVTHRGEYLRRIHRRFEAIRRYELDGAVVGAVRQQTAVGRCRGSVYRTGAVLGRVQPALALVFDRVDVHHQVSGLAARRRHKYDL